MSTARGVSGGNELKGEWHNGYTLKRTHVDRTWSVTVGMTVGYSV